MNANANANALTLLQGLSTKEQVLGNKAKEAAERLRVSLSLNAILLAEQQIDRGQSPRREYIPGKLWESRHQGGSPVCLSIFMEVYMRYADSNCTIACDGNDYIVRGRDRFTGTPVTVRVPTKEMFAYRQGAYLQDAMVSVSDAEREFLLSGMYDSFPFEEEDC